MRYRHRLTVALAGFAALLVAPHDVTAQERMGPVPADQLSPEQSRALAEFVATRGQATGPWNVLLRSPELMKRAKGLSDYLRFESILPGWLREFVILMTARQWSQNYEWSVHSRLALEEGLSPDIARALVEGRRPPGMVEEESVLYDFCMELQDHQSVSDATYERAVDRFGEQGVVEVVSLAGYYTMVSMVLNVARTALPKGEQPALTPFPR